MKKITLLLSFILFVNTLIAQVKKEYYENGQLKIIGKYENGKQIGEWKNYYENGKLKAIGEYTNIIVDDYTNDCKDAMNGSASYYRKKMEGITHKGSVRVDYGPKRNRNTNNYFFSGYSRGKAKLAVAEYGEFPVLVNQKYDNNGDLNGVDILMFQNYEDLVFIIEPLVKEACGGSYEVEIGSEDFYSNEKLYTGDKETAYDLESVEMKTVLISKIEWNNNVKNGEWKYYDENGSLVKTENYLNGVEQK